MRHVQAPHRRQLEPGDTTLFLAGGITGCPNWQADAVRMVADAPGVMLNPRQAAFDVADPEAGLVV